MLWLSAVPLFFINPWRCFSGEQLKTERWSDQFGRLYSSHVFRRGCRIPQKQVLDVVRTEKNKRRHTTKTNARPYNYEHWTLKDDFASRNAAMAMCRHRWWNFQFFIKLHKSLCSKASFIPCQFHIFRRSRSFISTSEI